MMERDPIAAARPGEVTAVEQMAAAASGDVDAFAGLAGGYTPLFQVDASPAAVPEPTRMLLLAVGSFGLILRRRRVV